MAEEGHDGTGVHRGGGGCLVASGDAPGRDDGRIAIRVSRPITSEGWGSDPDEPWRWQRRRWKQNPSQWGGGWRGEVSIEGAVAASSFNDTPRAAAQW